MKRVSARALGLLAGLILTLQSPTDLSAAAPDGPESLGGGVGFARHRLAFGAGYCDSGVRGFESRIGPVRTETRVNDLLLAVSYAYRSSENLQTQITLRSLVAEASSITMSTGVADEAVVVSSAIVELRYSFIRAGNSAVRPFLTAGVGPYIGVDSRVESRDEIDREPTTETRVLGAFGGRVGTGLDFPVGRHFMFEMQVGYMLMADFPHELGGRRNYSGIELGGGISLLI